MNQITITDKAKNVLAAIMRGATSREAIAKKLKVSVPTVTGSLNALKRNGLVEADDEGGLSVTPDANDVIGEVPTRQPRTGTKMEQARKLFDKYFEKGRPVVLEKFQTVAGLTAKGASTYYQTLQHSHAGVAHQRSGSKAKSKISRRSGKGRA